MVPRRAQAALEPYMTRFGELSGLVALHIRTGYADALREQPDNDEEKAELQASVGAALQEAGAPALSRFFAGDANEARAAFRVSGFGFRVSGFGLGFDS